MLTTDNIIGQSQMELVNIVSSIYDLRKKGKKEKEFVERGITIVQYLRLLNSREGIDEKDVETLLNCLISVANVKDFRLVKPVAGKVVTIVSGSTKVITEKGEKGDPGTNANIIVEIEEGEKQISVTETILENVKKYTLSSKTYSPPELTLSIVNGQVYQVGESVDIQLRVITTEGSEPIQSVNITSPGDLDLSANYDGDEVVIDGGVTEDTEYIVEVNDGTGTVVKSISVKFYHPVLEGKTDNTDNPYSVNKRIIPKEDTEILFDPDDEYFVIGHPSSYGVSKILSNNNNDVTNVFTKTIEDVTSAGFETEAGNWTHEYIMYRLPFLTSGINANYKLVYTE